MSTDKPQYIIAYAESFSASHLDLQDAVNAKMEEGYVPIGGLAMASDSVANRPDDPDDDRAWWQYGQAMVLRDPPTAIKQCDTMTIAGVNGKARDYYLVPVDYIKETEQDQ